LVLTKGEGYWLLEELLVITWMIAFNLHQRKRNKSVENKLNVKDY
jgi:hypothetical protein